MINKFQKFSLAMILILPSITYGTPTPLGAVTLHFLAQINNYSCRVNDDDTYVQMGNWDTRIFNRTGAYTQPASFALHLSDCPPAQTVTVGFSGANCSSSGLITLDPDSTAEGIAVQIQDSDGQVMTNSTPVTIQTNEAGGAIFHFNARYVSTRNTVTAGSANATISYTISYQ
ncbi:fimbrial protein [Pantoea ananatis]|uniref:fimbrial protein n=1 Tax=Pantoea ananas TaxID=553 RepID=UPI001C8A3401|nr:fimbrial protein [Pantoea ananatis]QZE28935.1 fimbrial protein [Pantoea ananatis]